jgi:hypothetical protein
MKVLTIRQPWASAIFNHGKDIENRSYGPRYRGPLIVHASQKPDKSGKDNLMEDGQRGYAYVDPAKVKRLSDKDFPNGVVLGVVDFYDIVQDSSSNWADLPDPDLYHWCLRNPRKLKQLIPLKGRLGLFPPPPHVAETIKRIL